MIDISICIPTYNRARMLRQCLEHIANFKALNVEVLVGDNASSDNTAEVVASLRSRLPHLVYLRHAENLGFARNMDSLLRRASGTYAYILNDDDLVFEDALGLAMSVLTANPAVSAVVGQYMSVRTVNADLTMDYTDAVAKVIKRGSYATLLDNLVFCDGHPIVRRETFERHCAYLDRTGGLMPLYFSLLNHGDIIVVDKPFFQHRTNSDSLSSRMVEPWFLDMTTADLELVVSGCYGALPPEALGGARQNLFHMIYFQSVRMAMNQKSPYLVWFFLRRLMALGGVHETLLLKCESDFIHDFLVDRVASILGDAEFATVHVTASETAQAAVADLALKLPGVRFRDADPAAGGEGIEILVCGERAELAGFAPTPRCVALDDLFSQLRLSVTEARLAADQGRVTVHYRDPAIKLEATRPLPAFDMIRAPYSETAVADQPK